MLVAIYRYVNPLFLYVSYTYLVLDFYLSLLRRPPSSPSKRRSYRRLGRRPLSRGGRDEGRRAYDLYKYRRYYGYSYYARLDSS
jgi:hypothetical protein